MAEICHRTSSTWIGYKKIYFSNKDTNLSIRAIFLSLTFICSSRNFLLSSLTSNNKSTNSSCLLRLHTFWCYFSSINFFNRFTCTFCTTHYTTPFPTLRTQFKGAILGSSTILPSFQNETPYCVASFQTSCWMFASSTAVYFDANY